MLSQYTGSEQRYDLLEVGMLQVLVGSHGGAGHTKRYQSSSQLGKTTTALGELSGGILPKLCSRSNLLFKKQKSRKEGKERG